MTNNRYRKNNKHKTIFGISTDDPNLTLKLQYLTSETGIPKYKEQPKLWDFGLPYDAKEIIDTWDAEWTTKLKRIKYAVFFTVLLIALSLLYTQTESVLITIFYGALIAFWLIVILTIVFNRFDNGPKELKELKSKYREYDTAVRAYEYWREKETYSFWDNLDGHQFEHEVASVFRNKGYNAVVTKGSGDGGVDIVLNRNGEKIAVQCKAHSKPVGPAVIRDLYGTMTNGSYNKAILVSKNGFTKGVYEFAEGKPIELMSLDNILAMVRK